MRRISALLLGCFFLASCTPETVGHWIRTQSGSIKEVGSLINTASGVVRVVGKQTKDVVDLGKEGIQNATKQAQDLQKRAEEVQNGVKKVNDGLANIKNGLSGTGAGK